ncbi:hypothetical protein ACLOJK_030090 [Asimina triloba]
MTVDGRWMGTEKTTSVAGLFLIIRRDLLNVGYEKNLIMGLSKVTKQRDLSLVKRSGEDAFRFRGSGGVERVRGDVHSANAKLVEDYSSSLVAL